MRKSGGLFLRRYSVHESPAAGAASFHICHYANGRSSKSALDLCGVTTYRGVRRDRVVDDATLPRLSDGVGLMPEYPTPIQDFALELLFDALRENVINRTADEYEQIKSRIPKQLKTIHHLVNKQLSKLATTKEFASHKICRFRAGDKVIREEACPTTISIETVRQALIAYGWRDARPRRRLSL